MGIWRKHYDLTLQEDDTTTLRVLEISLPLAIHDYKGDVFAVDNDLISILLEMRKQSIKPLALEKRCANKNRLNRLFCFRESTFVKAEEPQIEKRSLERLCLHAKLLLPNEFTFQSMDTTAAAPEMMPKPPLQVTMSKLPYIQLTPNSASNNNITVSSQGTPSSAKNNNNSQVHSSPVQTFLAQSLHKPPSKALRNALLNLVALDAFDKNEELTELGKYLADLHISPYLGRIAIHSVILKCLDPILTIVCSMIYGGPFNESLLSANDMVTAQVAFDTSLHFSASVCSDHLAMLRAFQAWQKSKTESVQPSGIASNQNLLSNYNLMSTISEGTAGLFCATHNLSAAKMEVISSKRLIYRLT